MKAQQRAPNQTQEVAPVQEQQQMAHSNSDRILQMKQAQQEEDNAQSSPEGSLAVESLKGETEENQDESLDGSKESQAQKEDPNEGDKPEGEGEGAPSSEGGAPPTVEDGAPDGEAEGNGGAPTDDGSAASGEGQPTEAAPAPNAPTAEAQVNTTAPIPVRPLISPAAMSVDPLLTNVWTHQFGSTPFQQENAAQMHLDTIHSFASLSQTELSLEASTLQSQVDAAINLRIGTINAQIDNAIVQTRAQFAMAKEKASTDLSGIRAQINNSTQTAANQISSSEQKNLGLITSGFSNAQQNIEPINAQTVKNVDAAWTHRVQEIRKAGEDNAQTILRSRDGLQKNWGGGEGINKDKNKARRKAASDVAAKYAAEFREKANKAATELDGGRSNIGSIVLELLRPIAGELKTQEAQVRTGVTDMAIGARETLETQKSASLQSCDNLQQQSQNTLLQQEEASIQQLEQTRSVSISSLRAAGDTIKAQILAAANGFGNYYSNAMQQLQMMLADGGDIPPEDEMNSAFDNMEMDLETTKTEQSLAMQAAIQGGISDLDVLMASAQASIQTAMASIQSGLNAASSEFSAKGQELGSKFSKDALELSGTLSSNMDDASVRSSNAAMQVITDTAALATDPESELMKNLDESKSSVIGELNNSAKSAQTEMRSTAESAASKIVEKPWYKKVWDAVASVASIITSIVVGIVVFAAIAAFCVGTFGAGPIALIAAGAIAGAVASVAGKFSGEAVHSLMTWSNKFSDLKSYARTFAVGFLAGGLSAGLGVLAPQMSAGLNLSLSSFGGAAFEQLGDIVFLGESWHWGEFLFTGAFAIGLSKVGDKLGKKALNNWTLDRIFPSAGVGNSWNRFQQMAAGNPLLKNLTTVERSKMWNHFIKGKFSGAPYSIISSLTGGNIKSEIKEETMGKAPGAAKPEEAKPLPKEESSAG